MSSENVSKAFTYVISSCRGAFCAVQLVWTPGRLPQSARPSKVLGSNTWGPGIAGQSYRRRTPPKSDVEAVDIH